MSFIIEVSPLLYLICTFRILPLHQTGLLKRWKQQYWPTRTGCEKVSTLSSAIEVKDLMGLFYAFLAMLVLSSAVFYCEAVYPLLKSLVIWLRNY